MFIKIRHRRFAAMYTYLTLAISFISTLLVVPTSPGRAEEGPSENFSIESDHESLKINTMYHGARVVLSGKIGNNSDLVVKISLPDKDEVLKTKGKVGGFLWMNVGELTYHNVPGFYMLRSEKDVASLLGEEDRIKKILGYSALRSHIEIDLQKQGGDQDKDANWWMDEFIKFNEERKLYSVSTEGISKKKHDEVISDYSVNIDWPFQAPPGDYTITAFEVEDGVIKNEASTHMKVEKVGMVDLLSKMAFENAALYGILSIGVALVGGLGIGMLFKKGGSK